MQVLNELPQSDIVTLKATVICQAKAILATL